MEYIEGPLLPQYISSKGAEWIPVLMVQLLSSLSVLHQQGWVFGDLKPDNLIVTGPPAAIRCIDVGERQNRAARLKSIRSFTTGAIGGMEQEKQNHPMTCLLSQ